ncbi:MAG: hypothetical protein RIS64_4586 [Bacteroidota bacterium]|jgi:hypothetical protein
MLRFNKNASMGFHWRILFELYLPICENVMLFDNSEENPIFVMKQIKGESMNVFKESTVQKIKQNLKNGFKAVNFGFIRFCITFAVFNALKTV